MLVDPCKFKYVQVQKYTHEIMEDDQNFEFSIQDMEQKNHKKHLTTIIMTSRKLLYRLRAQKNNANEKKMANKQKYQKMMWRLQEKIVQWFIFADLWEINKNQQYYVDTMQRYKDIFMGLEQDCRKKHAHFNQMIENYSRDAIVLVEMHESHRVQLWAQEPSVPCDNTVPDEDDYWTQQHMIEKHMWNMPIHVHHQE